MPVEVGSAVAYLRLDTSSFTNGLNTAATDLEAFTNSSNKLSSRLGSAFTKVGKSLTTFVTAPIVAFGVAATKTASDFEASMSKVAAISGASAEELDILTNKAMEMGAKTKFSAKESADAFTYMAMAGWNATQMVDGISGIMSLAAADGLDLATTSDIVTDALTAFGLQAADSSHFADVLAQASSSANTNVSMLGESFKYVGPVAGSLGYSIEDVSVALGLMANSGIKGSMAGTSLRQAFTSMINPTDKAKEALEELGIEVANSDGSMKSLSDVMAILRTSFSQLTDEQKAQYASTIFGSRAMSGMLAIINTSTEDYNRLSDAINNAEGRAESMSETMMGNLSGSMTLLKSALEGLAIKIGSIIAPTIQKVANGISNIVSKLNEMDDATAERIVKIAAIVAAIGPVLIILGQLVSAIAAIGTAITVLSGPVGWVIGATALLTAGIVGLMLAQEDEMAGLSDMQKEMMNTSDATNKLVSSVEEWRSSVENSKQEREDYVNDLEAQAATSQNLVNRLKELQEKASLTAQEQLEQKMIVSQLNSAMDGLNLSIDEQTGKLNMSTDAIQSNIEMMKRQAMVQAMQDDMTRIAKDQYEAEKKLYELNKQKEEQYLVMKAAEEEYTRLWQKSQEENTNLYEDAYKVWKKTREEYGEVTKEIALVTQTQDGLNSEFEIANAYMLSVSGTADGLSTAYSNLGDTANETGYEISGMSEEVTKALEEMYSSTKETIDNQIDLFEKFDDKTKVSGKELIKNMESQVEGVEKWADNLELLAERGIDKGLLQHLASLGPDGYAYVKAFADMTDEELERANSAFQESSTLSERAAAQITESYVKAGKDSADGFGEGAEEGFNAYYEKLLSSDAVPTEVKDKIRSQYKESGENAVEGFDEGMNEYYDKVLESADKIPTGVLDTIREKMGIHSPSTEMYELGQNSMQGYNNGLLKLISEPVRILTDMATSILGLNTLFYDTGAELMNNFWQGAKDVWTEMAKWLENVKSQASSVPTAGAGISGSHADGLAYVPYNGYIAELHEGERVLTKEENKDYSKEKNSSSGDTYNFYSPKPIDEYQAVRLLKQTKRDLEFV